MIPISEYSKKFKNLSEKQYEKNIEVLSSYEEKLRTFNDIKIIKKYIKGIDILDHPVGNGRLYHLLSKDFKVWGADISSMNIKKLKKKYPQNSTKFFTSYLEKIDTKKKFDTVISFRVINRILKLESVFIQIKKILKKNGIWLINIPPERVKEITALCQKHNFIIHSFKYDFLTNSFEFKGIEKLIFLVFKKTKILNKYTYNIFEFFYCVILKKSQYMFCVLKKIE